MGMTLLLWLSSGCTIKLSNNFSSHLKKTKYGYLFVRIMQNLILPKRGHGAEQKIL